MVAAAIGIETPSNVLFFIHPSRDLMAFVKSILKLSHIDSSNLGIYVTKILSSVICLYVVIYLVRDISLKVLESTISVIGLLISIPNLPIKLFNKLLARFFCVIFLG